MQILGEEGNMRSYAGAVAVAGAVRGDHAGGELRVAGCGREPQPGYRCPAFSREPCPRSRPRPQQLKSRFGQRAQLQGIVL